MLHENEVMKIGSQITPSPPASYIIFLIVKLLKLEERNHFCYQVNDKSVSREWQRATSMIVVSVAIRNYAKAGETMFTACLKEK